MTFPSPDPGRIPDDGEFMSAFDALAQAIRRARGAGTRADRDSLTLSQYGLLEPLLHRESARVRELATQAGVSAPTATRILDTLERRGLVRRDQARDDRRGVSIGLTEMGRSVLSAQHEWLREREWAFYASLPAHERAVAPDLLARLAALIDELAAGPTA